MIEAQEALVLGNSEVVWQQNINASILDLPKSSHPAVWEVLPDLLHHCFEACLQPKISTPELRWMTHRKDELSILPYVIKRYKYFEEHPALNVAASSS